MKKSLLKEYIDRVGIVTRAEMIERTGVAGHVFYAPFADLIDNREIYLCRMARGQVTYLSRHLMFCLKTVATEPDLTEQEQSIYDWLSDNQESTYEEIGRQVGLGDKEFEAVFRKLQEQALVVPVKVLVRKVDGREVDFAVNEDNSLMLWGTVEYWFEGLYRASRYGDVGYCVSEVKRMLSKHFFTREINELLYRIPH